MVKQKKELFQLSFAYSDVGIAFRDGSRQT